MGIANLPFSSSLCRSFITSYFHGVSHAFLLVEKNCYEILIWDICHSYGVFCFEDIIHCRSLFSKADLGVDNKVVGFNKPN